MYKKVNFKNVVVAVFVLSGIMQSCSTLEITAEHTIGIGNESKSKQITTGVIRSCSKHKSFEMLYLLGGFAYSKDVDIKLPLMLGFGVNYTPPVKKRFQWGLQGELASAVSGDYVYFKPDFLGRYYLTTHLALKGSIGFSVIGTDISANQKINKDGLLLGPTFSLGLTWLLQKNK